MNGIVRKSLVSSLALVMLLGPVLATTAEAGPKYRRGESRSEGRREGRGERRQERRVERRQESRRDYRGSRHRTVVYRDSHRHHDSGIIPFIGGVAVGAIIGSHRSCPPPVRRVYVYDCGFCRSDYRDYDDYLDHLVVIHHVDRCNIDRYYPVYQGGYWEEY